MKKFLKGAVVLLIAVALVFSSVAVTANTKTKQTVSPETHTTSQGVYEGENTRGIVWDNGMDYDGLMSSQWDESYPYDCYQADDFHFEEDQEVIDVHWIGGYWNPKENGGFDWCISFYKDDGTGTAPSGTPYQPSYAGPFCFTPNEYTEEFLEESETTLFYKYSVDLPESIIFNACEKYWISIWGVGVFPPQSGWGFHQTPITLSPAVWGSDFWGHVFWTPGFDVQGYDHDMCFQLTHEDPCNPSIDVEKYVWDPKNQEWVDADTESEALDLPICDDVTFKIVIHNDGDVELFNIIVKDKMHDSLKFKSGDPEPDEWYYEEPFYYMEWYFPGPLAPCETIEVYIVAHVEGPECSYDFNYVLVEGNGCGENVRDEDYAWVHAYEKGKSINTPFLNLLEKYLNMFPILRELLGL